MKGMNWIPVGSIVKLKNSEYEVLVVARGFILPEKNTFIYFDYYGVDVNHDIHQTPTFLFNNDDVDMVQFRGWTSPRQEQLEKKFFVNVVSKGIKKAKRIIEEQGRTGF